MTITGHWIELKSGNLFDLRELVCVYAMQSGNSLPPFDWYFAVLRQRTELQLSPAEFAELKNIVITTKQAGS